MDFECVKVWFYIQKPKPINADDNENITILNGQWAFSKQLHISTSQCALQQQRAGAVVFSSGFYVVLSQRKHCSMISSTKRNKMMI